MTDETRVHRYVTIEQVVRAEQPESTDLRELFRVWGLTNSTQESLWVVAIDNMDQLKTVSEVARGGFHGVEVHVGVVLAAVLTAHTDRFIIAHNHPAGSTAPTAEDMDLTARVMDASNELGLTFQDHVITGPAGWFSFADAGIIKRATVAELKAINKAARTRAAGGTR